MNQPKPSTLPVIVALEPVFPTEAWPWTLLALRHDRLVWKALSASPLGAFALETLPAEPQHWTPAALGLLALYQVDPQQFNWTDIIAPQQFNWTDIISPLGFNWTDRIAGEQAAPGGLQAAAAADWQAWTAATESTPPAGDADLPAELARLTRLALGLRCLCWTDGSWNGLPADLDLRRSEAPTLLACLYGLVPQPEPLLAALLAAEAGDLPALHAFLAQPLSEDEQFTRLHGALVGVSASIRLEALRRLSPLRPALALRLAEAWLPPAGATGELQSALESAPHDLARSFDCLAASLRTAQSYRLAAQPDRAVPLLAESLRTLRRLRGHLSAGLAEAVLAAPGGVDESWRETAQETGLEAWKQAVQLAPDMPRYAAGLVDALLAAGRLEDAAAFVAHHRSDLEHDAGLSLAAARLAHRQNDAVEFRRRLAVTVRLLAGQPGVEAASLSETDYVQLAGWLQAAGLTAELVDVAGCGLGRFPCCSALLELLAPAQLALGRPQDALQTVTTALALSPAAGESSVLRLTRVGALEAVGAWAPALEERLALLAASQDPTLDDLRGLARCAEAAGSPEHVEAACKGILAMAPDDLEAHRLLALAAQQRGDPLEAAGHFTQAVRLAPDQPELWIGLVAAYRQAGQEAQAIDTLRAAGQAVPNQVQIHRELGEAYLKLGQPTQALACFRRAAGLSSDPEIALLLGQTLLQLGRLAEVSQVLGPLVSQSPQTKRELDLAYTYARAELGQGRPQNAIPLLIAIVRSRPDQVEPCMDLARALMQAGSKPDGQPAAAQRAIPFLQRLLDLDPSGADSGYAGRLDGHPVLRAEARTLLAEAYAAAGETGLALEAFRRALDDPENHRPATQTRLSAGLGLVALKMDQPEVAVAALQDAAQSEPGNVELQRSLSDAYLASGLVQDAFQAASFAIQIEPEEPGLLDWFIRQAERLLEQPGASALPIRPLALQALEAAARLEPDRTDLLLKLGRSRLESGDRPGALEAFRCLAGKIERLSNPEAAEAARTARELGDAPLAVRLLKSVIDRRAADTPPAALVDLYAELSHAQQLAGDADAALQSAHSALALDEQNPRLHVRVADLLTSLDRLELALESIQTAVDLEPHDPALRGRAVDLLRRRSRWSDALEQAERGLDALDGTHTANDDLRRSLNLAAASLAHATLRPRRALAYLQAGLSQTDPASNEYANLALRAEIGLEIGDMELADPAIDQMERIDAQAPRTQAARARERHVRRDGAGRDRCSRNALRSLIQQAQQNPETPPSTREEYIAGFLSVAQAAIDARLWDEAIATLNRLIEIIPESPLAYFKLAQIAVLRGEAQCLCQDLDVVRHAPGAELLSDFARQSAESYLSQAQALLGADFNLDVSTDFNKWDDECRKTLGAWLARTQALFTPGQRTPRILETMLRMVTPASDEVAALIMAYRRSGETSLALSAVQVGWLPSFDGKDACYQPSILIQLALADPNPASALAHANDALQSGLGQANAWPPLPMLNYLVARQSYQQGAGQAAMQAVQQALTAWPDEPRWQELAGRIYLKPSTAEGLADPVSLSDPVKALVHLEAAASLDPHQAENHLLIGQIYLSGGQIERALPALEQACTLDASNGEAWLALARAQTAAGLLEPAAVSAEHAVSVYSGGQSGKVFTEPGENGAKAAPAVPVLQTAELFAALLLRGQIAMQTSNPRGAFSRAQVVLRAQPDNVEALYLMAHALEGLNRPADALAVLERALPLSQDPLPMQIERIQLVRRSQGLEAGITALQQMIVEGAAPAELLALLAGWLNEAGRAEDAVQAARRALEDAESLPPGDCAGLNLLIGLHMRRNGQLDQAIVHLNEAVGSGPANLEAYLELGRAYQDRREYRQALKVYQKAISVAGNDFRPYYQAGLVLKDSKDYLAAEAMLRRAAQVAPDEVSVHRLLGAVVALNLVHSRRPSPTQS